MSCRCYNCYRSGGCGPYEGLSCSECPASRLEYLERFKKQEPPKQEPAGEYIKKDRVIALIHKHFPPVVYSSHDPQWCSKCGALAYWNLHFQGWYCSACGSIYKPPKVDRPEVKELIEAIPAEPDT